MGNTFYPHFHSIQLFRTRTYGLVFIDICVKSVQKLFFLSLLKLKGLFVVWAICELSIPIIFTLTFVCISLKERSVRLFLRLMPSLLYCCAKSPLNRVNSLCRNVIVKRIEWLNVVTLTLYAFWACHIHSKDYLHSSQSHRNQFICWMRILIN